MDFPELAIVVGVFLVSAWLGYRAAPKARVVLWLSALLISAAMFLPSTVLRGLVGAESLASIDSAISAMSLSLASTVHFIAFLWLSLMLWTLRPDWRGWRVVAVLAVLAVAGELMQGLSVERSPRIVDVGVNLLGAGAGLLLAVVLMSVRKRLSA